MAARRPRDFKPRKTVAEICERELKNYRLTRQVIQALVDGYSRSRYATETKRSHAISDETCVLIGLRWLSKGGMLSETAAFHGVSKSSASRIVDKFASYVASLRGQYIKMPQRHEILQIAEGFHDATGMPRTVGCIDGTHVRIKAPTEDEHAYVNRKGEHSINIQVICDHQMIIRDVDCRWPGSTHDAFILTNSRIKERFEANEFGEMWLLGDSGYPCKPWLLTPLAAPDTPAERRYNSTQIRTRSLVERCIGLLKSRFRCLDRTGGICQLKIDRVSKVVMACAVLHNIATQMNLEQPDPDEEDYDFGIHAGALDDREDDEGLNMLEGHGYRRDVIDNYFG